MGLIDCGLVVVGGGVFECCARRSFIARESSELSMESVAFDISSHSSSLELNTAAAATSHVGIVHG